MQAKRFIPERAYICLFRCWKILSLSFFFLRERKEHMHSIALWIGRKGGSDRAWGSFFYFFLQYQYATTLVVKGKRKQLIDQWLLETSLQLSNEMRISGEDSFDAPSQLGFHRHGGAKFTATKSWFKTLRHRSRRDEPSKMKDIQHQWPLLGVHSHISSTCTCTFAWAVGVVTFCSRPEVGSRANDALSVSQILADIFENVMVTYASIFTGGPPSPNPVVTISTRVGPGSRRALLSFSVIHFLLLVSE